MTNINITNKDNERTKRFVYLGIGDWFIYKHILFIKIGSADIRGNAWDIKSVNMNNCFSANEYVFPCDEINISYSVK